jgi:hypothetical protein
VREARTDEQASIPAFDISALIALGGGGPVDLLKIDIERSEIELFTRSCDTWLPQIRNLCIELHDRECIRAFMSAMQKYDFELRRSGELHICQSIRLRIPQAYSNFGNTRI